ncbi:type II toxin-antitoxin system HicA family toxin [Azohydromonas aeria]|uniref:type II toxin-antitoxin system HicA family toxin n=1 Tax=Azohydromonas aeria TaxID=2590212 RepID=UPI0012FA812F|nr:type II toxin-antitoxin system HicA family toxin [Azohydromonas aeria]
MTKLPRDVTGLQLAKALARVGYAVTRQSGSHIRLTLHEAPGHHVTIPAHQPLKLGTLAAILSEVCGRLRIERDELLQRLGL